MLARSVTRCLFLSGIFTRVLSSSPSLSTFSPFSSPSRTFLSAIIGSSISTRSLCFLNNSSSDEENSERMGSISQGTPSIVQPKGEHKATVIFLHGLGDQGHGWADAFKSEVRLDNTKVICPHSAERSVTLNMGMRMPAWYDLFGLDAESREDDSGIASAAQYVHGLIDAEIAAGIPSNKIIVGGFSMGGALAIYSGLTYSKPLGGILGLSSFFLQRTKFPGSNTANNSTKIFLGHGAADFLVPLPIGQLSEAAIKKFNPNVQLHVYKSMAHSSCPQEMKDVQEFIKSNVL